MFAGNTGDATTVETMVPAMERKYGQADRVWVMDRGMVSEENLKFSRDRGGSYIVGTPKAMLRRFEQYLTDQDGQEVQAGVEVKLVPGPDGAETFILARSADRRAKEQARHERFTARLAGGLQKLQAAADSGRRKDLGLAQRRLGRWQERNWRAAGAFDVRIGPLTEPTGKARLSVTWTRNGRWSESAAISEGCYLLRTTLTDTDPATLWKQYIQLTEAEWAFRIEKDELEIRPIWHQTEDRVKAHILVCFLAYAQPAEKTHVTDGSTANGPDPSPGAPRRRTLISNGPRRHYPNDRRSRRSPFRPHLPRARAPQKYSALAHCLRAGAMAGFRVAGVSQSVCEKV